MKIAILGFAGQGQSSFEYWQKPGNQITICDLDESITVPEGIEAQLGKDYLANLDRFDLLIRTPSLHPKDIVAENANNSQILEKVWSNTNEFLKVCPTKNIIGVTGTKGKGTTSTLIANMLEATGKRVHLGGNIGTPPLDMLKQDIRPDDWVVLELANFQLIDLKSSPYIAVCLMVVAEHLDWHKDIGEYVAAKQQLFGWQSANDIAVYNAENALSQRIASSTKAKLIPYLAAPGAEVKNEQIVVGDSVICPVGDIKLLGKHNWQNVCAAVTAVWQISQDIDAIRSVLTTFTGLEHRLEFVRELGGVKYYDDSFGTTPETAIVAIEAFKEPKVIILGGSDKGSDYRELAQAVLANNVRSVIAIGQMGSVIADTLRQKGFHDIVAGGETMSAIVQTARQAAQPGDIVLLSTACASFDLFKNYKDRGEQFKQSVQELS